MNERSVVPPVVDVVLVVLVEVVPPAPVDTEPVVVVPVLEVPLASVVEVESVEPVTPVVPVVVELVTLLLSVEEVALPLVPTGTQLPPLHVWPMGHGLPHTPQCWTSLSKSAQRSVHSI